VTELASSTVAAVVRRLWQVTLPASALPSAARFIQNGWDDGEQIPRPCPVCAGALHSLRKPYVTRGRTQRYVALVCPSCPRVFQLSDLGAAAYSDLFRSVTPSRVSPRPAAVSTPGIPRSTAPAFATRVDPESARRSTILRFWRSVELFSAQTVGGVGTDQQERRYDLRPDGPAPWENGHPLSDIRIAPSKRWKFTVYVGLYGLDELHRTLDRVFPENEFDLDERIPRGTSALFAVEVTEQGELVLDSLTLSTAAWAVGRTVDPGPSDPGWLDGFEQVEKELSEAVEAIAGRIQNDDDPPISQPVRSDFFWHLLRDTAERLGVHAALAPTGIRVVCQQVPGAGKAVAGTGFLNSFVARDLDRVAAAVARGECGPALAEYLSATPPAGRFDVRSSENLNEVASMLAPDRVPAGRWPANPQHTAATSQQLAVNELMRTAHPTFGVNGPPGTGKTTMLRDLVAAVVTERARRLADLDSPADAFADSTGWATRKGSVRFRALRDDLVGFEMLVASSNNTAVENVTREMPAEDAIDEPFSECRYLDQFSSRLLGAPSWGLIAAALGNQSNRNHFANRLLFPADDHQDQPGASLIEWLRAESGNSGPGDWKREVLAFRAALGREEAIRAKRVDAWTACRAIPQLTTALDHALAQQESARQACTEACRRAEAADERARLAADEHRAAALRRERHQQRRPKFWEVVFTFGRLLRAWSDEDGCLREEEDRTGDRARLTADNARAERDHRAASQLELTRRSERYHRALAELENARAAVHAMVEDGVRLPNARWYEDEVYRESAAPWLDPVWDEARSRVFIAALHLHQAFLVCAGEPMRALLRAALHAVKGKVPPGASSAALTAAWRGLFLVVPVVSTTFASVDRMLAGVGSDALGWLLIDEAGQGAPQQAAGAIWRAQRLVAVGDPLQLEPIVTVLHSTQARMRDHYGVDGIWLPSRESVQTLADRVASIGTMQRVGDHGVWVGAPLRAHRRCQDPMFSVVNSAVYGGLMIQDLPPDRTPAQTEGLPSSRWFDVPSGRGGSHWIPAEGRVADRLLRSLTTTHHLDLATDVLVLSPFRTAAHELTRMVSRSCTEAERMAGTVHRSQGRQARVVIFVLGGDPSRLGARDWAASTPNLFNVAVSRAKERIYVIGDHADWSRREPYFSVLARSLPVAPPDAGALLGGFDA